MNSEWPHSVQVSTHSIQNIFPEPEISQNEEITPLLHSGDAPWVRNMWITFFTVFLFIGLAAGAYLLLTEEAEWPISENNNYTLKTRKEWQAKKTTLDIPKLNVPVEQVLLTKTNSPECTKTDCSKEIHKIQHDHLNRLQEPDIGYNFLIAGDGQTYEGRGWEYQAMVLSSNSNTTLVIAFLGIFNNSIPSKKQINQAKSFLKVSESKGKLRPCYSILGETTLEPNYNFFENTVLYLQEYFKKRHKDC